MPRSDAKTRRRAANSVAGSTSDSSRDAKQSSGEDKSASEPARWTFFSNHAHVLICLYQDSEMVLRELAQRVGITERSVQTIIQDLEQAGYIERERVGRRNRYHVIRNKHLRHPIEEHCTIDMLVDVILANS